MVEFGGDGVEGKRGGGGIDPRVIFFFSIWRVPVLPSIF